MPPPPRSLCTCCALRLDHSPAVRTPACAHGHTHPALACTLVCTSETHMHTHPHLPHANTRVPQRHTPCPPVPHIYTSAHKDTHVRHVPPALHAHTRACRHTHARPHLLRAQTRVHPQTQRTHTCPPVPCTRARAPTHMRAHPQRHTHTQRWTDTLYSLLHVMLPPRPPWFWAKPCISEQPSLIPSFFCSTVSLDSVPLCPRVLSAGDSALLSYPQQGREQPRFLLSTPSETARASSLSLSPPVSSKFVNCLSAPHHARKHAHTRSRALTHVLRNSTAQEDTSMASGLAHHCDLSARAPGPWKRRSD